MKINISEQALLELERTGISDFKIRVHGGG